jgi:hypothetical protein
MTNVGMWRRVVSGINLVGLIKHTPKDTTNRQTPKVPNLSTRAFLRSRKMGKNTRCYKVCWCLYMMDRRVDKKPKPRLAA